MTRKKKEYKLYSRQMGFAVCQFCWRKFASIRSLSDHAYWCEKEIAEAAREVER